VALWQPKNIYTLFLMLFIFGGEYKFSLWPAIVFTTGLFLENF